ncbi:J domain-containing protein, partial [Microcoleus sp. AT10_D2]
MNDLDQYYKVLGLLPGASREEISQAYKDLAFIWHPDRIPKDNPRLLQKAEEKIKEINQAREQLRSIQPRGQNQNVQHKHTQHKHTQQQNTQHKHTQQQTTQQQNAQYRNTQQQTTQQQNAQYRNTQQQ